MNKFRFIAPLFFAVAACGSTEASPSLDGGRDATMNDVCVVGAQTACACSGGSTGTQVCVAGGTLGACKCPSISMSSTTSRGTGASSGTSPTSSTSTGSLTSGSTTLMSASRSTASDVSSSSSSSSVVRSSSSSASASSEGCVLPGPDAGTGGTLNWASRFGIDGNMSVQAVAIDPNTSDIVMTGYFDGSVNFGGGVRKSHGDAAAGSDTFVAKFNSAGAYIWAKTFGNGMVVGANGVTVDASGNIVLAGEFFGGSINFGGTTLQSVGNDDLFLVEFDAAGGYKWGNSFGTSGQSQGLDTVAVDALGNVFIAGGCNALDFGGGAKTGDYIARFDSTGAYSWSDAFPTTTSYGGPWLAVDGVGDMILAGNFESTVNFGHGTLTSAGSSDVFVAKFDSSGTCQWANHYGDASVQAASGVVTDSCGNIVITGNFGGTINFGSGAITAAATGGSVFLAKLDSSGAGVWSKPFFGSSNLTDGPVAVDASGGPVIANALTGSVDFGGGTLTSAGSASMTIAHFDANGEHRWSYVGGAPSTAPSSGPANNGLAGTSSSIVIAGAFGAAPCACTTSPPGTTLVLDGTALVAGSADDIFLASFVP